MGHMERVIEEFRVKFPVRGKFELSQGQRIREVVRSAEVPDRYGIYIISDPQGRVLYIGRAGTVCNDGTFKRQTLRRRLTNKQDGLPRQQFFEDVLRIRGLESLHFEWFVTFDREDRVLPCLAESELLQAYFNDYGRLPPYNKTT